MKKTLLTIYEGQLKIGTWDLAKDLGIQHRILKMILKKYDLGFLQVGGSYPHVIKKMKRGAPVKECLLCITQLKLLIGLLPITKNKIVWYKIFIADDRSKTEVEFFQELDNNL